MSNIEVGRSDFRRGVSRTASSVLKNRFFEFNPVLNASEDFPSLISRPALRKFMDVGTGPIRKIYDEPGAFDDAAFIVSNLNLYKLETDGTDTDLGAIGSSILGSPSMAATAWIGTVPEFLFITDGGVLWVYMDVGASFGTLTSTGAIANGDVIRIDTIYYQWTSGSVDAGTPAGTVGNPWLVDLGASVAEAITAMYHAINGDGVPGTDYSTVLVLHPTATAYTATATALYVAARTPGTAGDAIVTTETGANIAWGAGTLQDGGDPQLRQVSMPGDVGAVSVAYIASYVIVIPVQDSEVNGRFYWIEPGEYVVDPLNFATAERSPDAGNQVIVFSDRFWICGQTTTEAWVVTGNVDAPVQRFSGVLYDRGAWEGTALKVKDSMVVVDEDGAVFQIAGGLKRLTHGRPDIEERIRRAMQFEAFSGV